mmetsp:Transcript_80796/g.228677  ORF Transcript_80796/g.228677 Transcript_80796/m.228677 type:complete len:98 (-) Transcript_80796:109-402(-)
MTTVYHYTSPEGLQGIRSTGQINANDGAFGTGVYVTDLPWGTSQRVLDNHVGINARKCTACIVLALPREHLEACRSHVWVHRSPVNFSRCHTRIHQS